MKDKIMIFIIGLLVGAVISTGAFYIYSVTVGKCDYSSQNTMMNNGGGPPEMPNGQPPEKPEGDNGEPPEKPSDNNTQNSNTKESNY